MPERKPKNVPMIPQHEPEVSEAPPPTPAVRPEGHAVFKEVRLTTSDKSPIEVSTDIDGHRVSLAIGATSIIVADVAADDMAVAQMVASEIAEGFLDYVSYRHGFSTKLRHGHASGTSHDAVTGKTTYHIAGTVRSRVSVSGSFVATRADGTVIFDSQRPGHVAFRHSVSMRYFRAAAKAPGVFEQFRNYYLAAEHAASVLAPDARGDRQTFLQGLDCAFGSDSSDLVRTARGYDSSGAPATTRGVGMLLYKRYRCALNHAKSAETKLIPLQAVDEGKVRSVLPLMRRVAQHMIRAELERTATTP